MSQQFLTALMEEISSLEAELQQDVRYRRLTELRKLLRLYENNARSAPESSLGANGTSDSVYGIRRGRVLIQRRSSPERQKILELAYTYVGNRSDPVPTKEILAFLEGEGSRVPGENAINNLSAMLSNSELFSSHGRSGWTRSQSYFFSSELIEEEIDDSIPDNDVAIRSWNRNRQRS